MKFQRYFYLVLLSLLTFSCVDELTDLGAGVRPATDDISIGFDTVHLSSKTFLVDSILSVPDSFLLGQYVNVKYGTIKSDILTGIKAAPEFVFPKGAVADSAVLVLYYNSWFGDALTGIELTAYEITKKPLNFTDRYYSTIKPEDYVDFSTGKNIGRRVFTYKDAAHVRPDTTFLKMKLDTVFRNKIFERIKTYNMTGFEDYIKGIYLTSTLGSSSVLNVAQMTLQLMYHYKYFDVLQNKMVTVSQTLPFAINREVKKVNRIYYNKNERLALLSKIPDTTNYVVAPANMNTQITIPLNKIQNTMNSDKNFTSGRRQLINTALLKLDVNELDLKTDTSLTVTKPMYMVLVKNHFRDKLFEQNYKPSSKDTIALLGNLSYTYNDTTKTYKYYYSFELASMIAQELRSAKDRNLTTVPDLNLTLLPVAVEATSSSYGTTISALRNLSTIGAVSIRSAATVKPAAGKTVSEPMHLKLIYSIF